MAWIDDVLKSLYVMASLVEARDPYTGGHLWRVSQFGRLLAGSGGLEDADVARVALGGFLHDLGKVGVPDAILNKPDRLSEAEYAIVKTHPELGERVLLGHPLASLVRAAVLSHHEMPNGRGYPHRLQGAAIPVEARIIGIADAFDAMTSTRPYRRGMPIERALGIIRGELGEQFDREWGERFLELGEAGALDLIVGHSEPGIPLQDCPNCGPTIVLGRRHTSGSFVYCRCCGAEAVVDRRDGALSIAPSGRQGTPDALRPDVDEELVLELAHSVLTPGLRAAIAPLLAPAAAPRQAWWQRLLSVD
jgi:hypothetical protein